MLDINLVLVKLIMEVKMIPTIKIKKENEKKIGAAILLFAVVAVAMTEVTENIILRQLELL